MSVLNDKLKQIRALVLDVDGILTNGQLHYSDQGHEIKSFHVHDGLGLKLLQRAEILTAVITARGGPAVERRLAELNIQDVFLHQSDKLTALTTLQQKYQLQPQHIAYMGDDLPDMSCLRHAGVSITVPDANPTVQQICDWQTTRAGGFGAVREVCDKLLQIQGHYEKVSAI